MSVEPSAEVKARAIAAGLDRALAEHPADIAAAAATALAMISALKPPTDPAAEPWPPMHPGFPA